MISNSRRDSVGGGVVAEFFRDDQEPTRFSVEGGGVVAEFFSDLQLRNLIFTQHLVIFCLNTKKIAILARQFFSIKFPQFREFSLQFRETWRSRPISGDSRKFRETWQVCIILQ